MRRAVIEWNWPETMALLRMLVQEKSANQIAAALGKGPNVVRIRIEELATRYPDVMERIMGKPLSTIHMDKPVDIHDIHSPIHKNKRLTARPNGNAQV